MLKNKLGLSTIVASVIMIALVVSATAIVCTFVNKMIKEETESASSCFQVLSGDKVVINSEYTCYNSDDFIFQFSIGIGEIELDEVLVSISGAEKTKSFKLNKNGWNVEYVNKKF